MTDRHPNDTNTPRRLNPWNPLDHLRLLWWVLVTPQRLVAYREAYGENAERSVGKWLSSTLTWLPLFIPTLALGLETLPGVETAHLPATYLWTGAGLILTWVLTGWLGDREEVVIASMISVIVIFVAYVGARSAILGVTGGAVAGLAIVSVAVVTRALANVIANTVARAVAGLVMAFAALEVAYVVAGRILGVVIFVVALIMASRVLNPEEDFCHRYYWLARGAFGVLLLVYVLLIWFSFFGGWRAFQ